MRYIWVLATTANISAMLLLFVSDSLYAGGGGVCVHVESTGAAFFELIRLFESMQHSAHGPSLLSTTQAPSPYST